MLLRGVGIDPFVGRERELAELSHALDRAREGRGGLFLVSGEPGIGKTRLARELEAIALARDVRVAWGRCWEGGGAPAYWPWTQILRTLLGAVGPDEARAKLGGEPTLLLGLVPELAPRSIEERAASDDHEARFRLCDAATRFIQREAAIRPVVLILDDMHAADAASVFLLRFLARELAGSAILVVVTFRDVEMQRQATLAAGIADAGREGTQIRLGGLTLSDLGRYIAEALGHEVPATTVGAVHRVTEGNPFFVDDNRPNACRTGAARSGHRAARDP